MEGRLTVIGACLLLSLSGCKNRAQNVIAHSNPPPQVQLGQALQKPPTAHMPVAANVQPTPPPDDGKREPRVAIAMAAYKEADARTMERNPELQFKVRDQARKLYQEALKQDPDNINAHRGLARVYVDLADFQRAQDILNKARAKFPKESIFLYEQAQLHNRKKEFSPAVAALNQAIAMEPENRVYLTTLGMTLARAGHTDHAVSVLSRSMGAGSAHYNVARMLLHLNRHQEAAHHLRVAVQQNPNLEAARQMLAQMENGGQPPQTPVSFDHDIPQ